MNRRAYLKKHPTWVLNQCRAEGCHMKFGPQVERVVSGNERSSSFLSLLWPQRKNEERYVESSVGVIKPATIAEVVSVLQNRSLLSANNWLQLPCLSERQSRDGTDVRFSTQSLLEHPHDFGGWNYETGFPVLFSHALDPTHKYTIGNTRSGKTTNDIARYLHSRILSGVGGVIILDMKGDSMLFHMIRYLAKLAGRDFKYFSLDVGKASYVFNPLDQNDGELLTFQQRGEQLLRGLGLIYGRFYGASYFESVNRSVLTDLFCKLAKNLPLSLAALNKIFQTPWGLPKEKKIRQDSLHLQTSVKALSRITHLNVTKEDRGEFATVAKESIQIKEVMAKSQVVYFDLSVEIGGEPPRDVGRLVNIACQRAAAILEKETGGNHPPLYLVIDEFHEVIDTSFARSMDKGSGHGLYVLIAHQRAGQLIDGPNDFRDIPNQAQFRRYFNVEASNEEIMAASGQSIVPLRGVGQSQTESLDLVNSGHNVSFSNTTSEHEVLLSRLGPNEFQCVNADRNLSIVHIGQGRGFSHFGGAPFILYSPPYFDKEFLDSLRRLPWPPKTGGTLVIEKGQSQDVPSIGSNRKALPSPSKGSHPMPELTNANSKQTQHQKRAERQEENRKKGMDNPLQKELRGISEELKRKS